VTSYTNGAIDNPNAAGGTRPSEALFWKLAHRIPSGFPWTGPTTAMPNASFVRATLASGGASSSRWQNSQSSKEC